MCHETISVGMAQAIHIPVNKPSPLLDSTGSSDDDIANEIGMKHRSPAKS